MPPSAPPPKRQRKSGGARPRAAAAAAPACAGEGARARVPLTAHAPDLTDADPLLRVAQLRALEEMAAVPATQRAAVAARNTADWNRANRAQHKWRYASTSADRRSLPLGALGAARGPRSLRLGALGAA